MASSIQATRLRKGMLIKVGSNLFRILDLHHLTPGNKRAHIQVRMRNIRTGTLADEKFRAEEDIERATLDTGLVVNVPPFVNEGDKVRINTETGEYQSRV